MKTTGAEILTRSLIENGISHAFNVPGLGLHPLMDALKHHRDSIKYFTGPSETAVTVMADGYGRASGRPAFVNLYHASGTALGSLGVSTAWADRSPMIFTTTTSSRRLERRDQYASVPGDITETTRQFTKWSWQVPMAARIPEAVARAVVMATTPPFGPVHLAFPMDIYTEEVAEQEIADALMARPSRLRVFTAAAADPEGVREAAALLRVSKRPLIVVGGEVAQHGAVGDLVRLAEDLGAAVLTEPYLAFMGFPNDHRLFAGRFSPASPLVKAADVILAVGAEFTETAPLSSAPPADSKIVFMATCPLDLGKQLWADVGLVGHLRTSLQALGAALRSQGQGEARTQWASEIADRTEAYRTQLAEEIDRTWEATPIGLPRLIKEVEKVFGSEALILDHATTGTAYLLQMYDFPDPSRYFGISARASAQGWGVPAAMGIQIARPDRRVVAFVGDGGFMFTANALQAAALWRLPLVVIVLNNGGWHDVAYGAQKNRGWTDNDLKEFGWVPDPPIDYAGLARSLGVSAMTVAAPAELPAALAVAHEASGPTLLEVRTDPNAIAYYLSFIQR